VIVDDDADIRDSLTNILEGEGYTVSAAPDKTQGMQTIKDEKPDLIVLDVMMTSWQDGLDMARELKKDSDVKDTKILMLTGMMKETGVNLKPTAGDPEWCPVDAFLHKPVDPDALLGEIDKLLAPQT
jgi:CheY-like chemotaxis protein